jgi:hypothetical protein
VLAYHSGGAALDVLVVTPFEPGDGPYRVIAKFTVRDGGDAEVSGLSWFLDDPAEFEEELLAPYPVFDVGEPITVTLLGDGRGRLEFAVAAGGRVLFPGMSFAVEEAGALVLK